MINPTAAAMPRILIYGHEIGGQMQLLAEALRARGLQATAAAVNDDFRRFRCDVHVLPEKGGIRRGIARWAFGFFAVASYDVFHFFWGVSLLHWWRFHRLDLPLLRALRKRVIVHFRGLDVVDIGTFDDARASASGPGGVPHVRLKSRPAQVKAIRSWRRWADTLLISEPDLWDVVPDAILSPQVVDVNRWPRRDPPPGEGSIKILHAPTNRRKKGTEFVIQACDQLRARGLDVQLLLVENMPYTAVVELYRQADIAVDQLLYGWHGKFSVETMCMGIPTVCFLREDLLRHRPDLPLVRATPATLADTLEKLIGERQWRQQLAAAGPEYVRRYHSVEAVVTDLLDIYDPSGALARSVASTPTP